MCILSDDGNLTFESNFQHQKHESVINKYSLDEVLQKLLGLLLGETKCCRLQPLKLLTDKIKYIKWYETPV